MKATTQIIADALAVAVTTDEPAPHFNSPEMVEQLAALRGMLRMPPAERSAAFERIGQQAATLLLDRLMAGMVIGRTVSIARDSSRPHG